MPGRVVVERDGQQDVVYEPLPHQSRFHASSARYCLLEGSRGGGKSKAMRWDAYLRCLSVPRFRALIVRRTMPELQSSHLNDVPYEITQIGLDPRAWHSTLHIVRFPNGSTLRFGHAEDDAALVKYLSSEYEAVYFDELATFTLRQFTFICSSLRSPLPGYQPIARAGTNPVGPGAAWVKRFFIDRTPSREEAPDYDPADYETIHCDMDDNPHIDQAHYAKVLNAIPSEALRRALRHGEWVIEGQFFSEWRERTEDGLPWHVLDEAPRYRGRPLWEAAHIEVVRALDWGYAATGNPGVCLWFACLPDGSAIGFREFVFKEMLPKDVAAQIQGMSEGLTIRYTVGDVAMWQEHEGPSIAETFARHGLSMIEGDKARVPGLVELHTWLRETVTEGLRPRPRLSFLREACPLTIRAFPAMLIDPKNPHDMVTVGVEDDAPDAARYFVMSRPGRSADPVAAPDPRLAWIRREMAKRLRRDRALLPTGRY